MEKFQQVIFKLAESHPNAPLTPAARTLLQDRLARFVSQYRTPDHPPYSAMIERAIRELNEKRGSREDSISRFLEKEYPNLPWAHSPILTHHLANLCKSGDIVLSRNKRYKLAVETQIPILNSSSTEKVKKRKPIRRRTRWRWDWEKSKRQHKMNLIKLRIKQEGKIIAVIEKHQDLHDEKEQQLTEGNGGGLVFPCMATENGKICSDEASSQNQEIGPSVITQEHSGRQQSEYSRPEILKPPGSESSQVEISEQQETGPSGITQAERQQSEHSRPEISKPPCFAPTRLGYLPNLGPAQLEPALLVEFLESEHHERQQSECSRLELSKLLDSEAARLDNSPNSDPEQLEPMSAEELSRSDRARRQLRRWNASYPEPKPVMMTSVESVHSNPETPQDKRETLDSDRISVKHRHLENDLNSVGNYVKYSRKRKTKSKQSEPIVTDESLKTDQGLDVESEHPFVPIYSNVNSNEKEPQEQLQPRPHKRKEILQENKQSRRSVRLRLAKPEVTRDDSYVIALPSQQHCRKTVSGHQSETSKQKPVNQQPMDLPINPADKKDTMMIIPPDKPNTRRSGRPRKCLCFGLNKDMMKSTEIVDRLECEGPSQVPKHRGRGRPPNKDFRWNL